MFGQKLLAFYRKNKGYVREGGAVEAHFGALLYRPCV